MGVSFKQLRKLHEAHEARHALFARRMLSYDTHSNELLEITCTDQHEQSHHGEDGTQTNAPDEVIRSRNIGKRVRWADGIASCSSERKSEHVGPWDEAAKRMISIVCFLMYCTLPAPGTHFALLEDVSNHE